MGKQFTLTFAGDTSLAETFLQHPERKAEQDRLQNPLSFFEKVAALLADSEKTLLNFGSVLSDGTEKPELTSLPNKPFVNVDYSKRTLKLFQDLGVNAVSLANNHSIDFGAEQLIRTCEFFDQTGITPFGAGHNLIQAAKPYEFMLQGQATQKPVFVFNFMRASQNFRDAYDVFASGITPDENSPGVCGYEKETLEKAIKLLRKNVPDALIICYPHRQGANYTWANKSVAKRYRRLIRAGADLVIGHGGRMSGQIEQYRGGIIAYSLGAFVVNSPSQFDSTGTPPYGLVARLQIEEFMDGWELKPEFYPIYVDNLACDFTPYPASKEQADSLFQSLHENQLQGAECTLRQTETSLGYCYTMPRLFFKHQSLS